MRISNVLILIVAVMFVSCRAKKNLVVPDNKPAVVTPAKNKTLENTIKQINQSANVFNYYQSKAKAKYNDGSKSYDFDMAIVMEKDKYVWISVTALLGIEVARIMITTDSVKILDRLHRKCLAADFNYIQKISNVPLTLIQIQHLIIGNTLFENQPNNCLIDTVSGNPVAYTMLGNQKQTTTYNNQFKVQKTEIKETAGTREMAINYKRFAKFVQNAIPDQMDINIRAEKNLSCNLELSNFAFEKKKEVQFTVPGSYEMVKP